jgi:hypothetical protein
MPDFPGSIAFHRRWFRRRSLPLPFHAMSVPPGKIRFKAKLSRPAAPRSATWSFLLLPLAASGKLPTRGMVTVDGMLGGHPFQATLEPDGQGSHWLKVDKALREAAGAAVGDTIALAIAPVDVEPEPKVPADLREVLAANPAMRVTWDDITPAARRDWIHWITSGKKAETRERRIRTACDMLAAGKRRACCFDRSGIYSKAFNAPTAAEWQQAGSGHPAARRARRERVHGRQPSGFR